MAIQDEISFYTHSNLWYSRVLNNWWLYKMKYHAIHIVIYGTLECSIIDIFTRWNQSIHIVIYGTIKCSIIDDYTRWNTNQI